MKKILVISPSGEVYDHDCVRWYSGMGFREAPDHYHNIGDAFVFDSSLKLLRYAQFNGMNIRNPTDADIERYNTEYDYAFLRGSNYLHPAMDWENAPAVLAKLRIPVIAFGIGAQAPSKGPLVLNEATRRVLALIADRSVSMGVRGAGRARSSSACIRSALARAYSTASGSSLTAISFLRCKPVPAGINRPMITFSFRPSR